MSKGKYTPLQDVLIALNEIIKSSGMSLREITRKTEKYGLNLNNVCSVANGHPEQLSTIVGFDEYVSTILRATGYDEIDLIKRTLEGLTNPRSSIYKDELSPELRDFMRKPESDKYIRYAYKMYQRDKLTEELEGLNSLLEKKP